MGQLNELYCKHYLYMLPFVAICCHLLSSVVMRGHLWGTFCASKTSSVFRNPKIEHRLLITVPQLLGDSCYCAIILSSIDVGTRLHQYRHHLHASDLCRNIYVVECRCTHRMYLAYGSSTMQKITSVWAHTIQDILDLDQNVSNEYILQYTISIGSLE